MRQKLEMFFLTAVHNNSVLAHLFFKQPSVDYGIFLVNVLLAIFWFDIEFMQQYYPQHCLI
jgi:hypothetical protein